MVDNGLPIDTSGVLTLSGDQLQFNDAPALMDQIARRCEAQRCFLAWWLAHATGGDPAGLIDDLAIHEAMGPFIASGLTVSSAIAAITETSVFLAPPPPR